jgi:phenylacetate-CoA ligase
LNSILEKIYFTSPVWVQNLMVTVYGLKLKRERYGRLHDEWLEKIERTPLQDAATVREVQLQLLRRTVRLAFAEVPFYQEFARETGVGPDMIQGFEDLARLPIIDKEAVRREPRRFCSTQRLAAAGVIELHTSGTTGNALTIFCDAESRQRHYAFWSRLRRWNGLQLHERRATMFGRIICSPERTNPPFWRYDGVGKNLLMSSYHLAPDFLQHYAHALQRYRPAEILGYASSVFLLARYLCEHTEYQVRPRVVFTTADTLLPQYRPIIEEAFQCPLIDQYGCAEMAVFASQEGPDSYLVHPEHGLLEVVDEKNEPVGPGETGEAICTGFVNDVMPLLRYRLGDVITVADDPGDCRPTVARFRAIEGRVDDILVSPEGRPLGRLSPIWKVVPGIHETQVVQNSRDSLDVHLVIDDEFSRDQSRESILLSEIRKRTGSNMEIRVHYVESIPKNKNGKFRTVISRIAN